MSQSTGPLRFAAFLVLLGGLFATPPSVKAQDDPQFGVALGLNLATLEAPTAETGIRELFTGGVVARMGLVGRLSVQGELMFAQKGAAIGEEGNVIRYGASYVDLPLMLRLAGPTLGPVQLYGMAGGFGGLKVFEQQRAGDDLSLPLDTGTSFFRRTNAGAIGGLGGTISIGGGRGLNLLVRYSHGLVDVARPVDEQPFRQAPFPPEAHTRTVSVMLLLGL